MNQPVPAIARSPRRLGMAVVLVALLMPALLMPPPGRAGLVSGAAEDAAQRFSQMQRFHTALILHQGETVLEHVARGPALDRPVNIKSLSKTVLAALVGVAIHRGIIDGPGQPVTELLGDRVPANTTSGVERITVGHLLSMQAGLQRTSGEHYGAWVTSDNWVAHVLTRPFRGEPGGRMRYSTGNTHLLAAALVEQTGRSLRDLARDWLGAPLSMRIPDWPRDPQGIHFGGNDMRLSPRGLARFGEMMRQGGTFDGERVLPPDWIRRSWQPRGVSRYNNDGYGYGWFVTELNGYTAYYGWGYGGQLLYLIPERELTVVITSDPTPPSPGSSYPDRLEAVIADTILPALQR